tara:strand:+ start:22666 stop:23034 length:369 start_codon:yes stop_codon:yes gene_type:complete
MKLFDELNNENFELFAAKHYDNPACLSTDEFYHDLAKFKYIVRLLRRYRQNGKLQEKLILNHIILIYNVFKIHAATRMLFFRVDEDLWPALKTFMIYLNYIQRNTYRDINIDLTIAAKLKQI